MNTRILNAAGFAATVEVVAVLVTIAGGLCACRAGLPDTSFTP